MAAASNASGGATVITSVGNSALFDSANSESLTRAFGAPDSTTKGTFRTILGLAGGLGSYRVIFGAGTAGTDFMNIRLDASDNLQIIGYVSNTLVINKITSMRFRDVLSFYDIVCRFDSTNAIASSRFILEVNGVTITDFSTDTGLTLNSRIWLAENLTSRIGRHGGTDLHYGNFYLAETSWLDNNLEPASSFGEFDTTGLYWTPKSSTVIQALTFGTNGFYLDNTTNAETDASGEGNNFTNNNTVVTSTNTPTNVGCLLNPLDSLNVLSSGNTIINAGSTSSWRLTRATLPFPPSGSWYWETSNTPALGGTSGFGDGMCSASRSMTAGPATQDDYFYGRQNDSQFNNDTGSASGAGSWANNAIHMNYYNADTNEYWFGVDGTWWNSNNASTTLNTSEPDMSSIVTGVPLFPCGIMFVFS